MVSNSLGGYCGPHTDSSVFLILKILTESHPISVWALLVSGAIRLVKVQVNNIRPDISRLVQPSQHTVNPHLKRHSTWFYEEMESNVIDLNTVVVEKYTKTTRLSLLISRL